MKLFFALFAATVATAAADGVTTAGSAADLATRWDMADEPDITYDSATNTFTIDYLEASGFGEYQEEFYDVNCKDDGSGFPENVVSQYFTDAPTGSGRPDGARVLRQQCRLSVLQSGHAGLGPAAQYY